MMRWRPTSVQRLPFSLGASEGVSLRGVPKLPTKRSAPVVWRFLWPWRVIHIENAGEYYWTYFFVAGQSAMRRGWWMIYADEVAVRVGPEPTIFYFCGGNGVLLKATATGGLLQRQQVLEQYPEAVLI